MQELVVYKSTHFLRLDRMEIRQLNPGYQKAVWKLPEPLESLAAAAELQLCIIGKKPRHPVRVTGSSREL